MRSMSQDRTTRSRACDKCGHVYFTAVYSGNERLSIEATIPHFLWFLVANTPNLVDLVCPNCEQDHRLILEPEFSCVSPKVDFEGFSHCADFDPSYISIG